jgi:hypothetical protein
MTNQLCKRIDTTRNARSTERYMMRTGVFRHALGIPNLSRGWRDMHTFMRTKSNIYILQWTEHATLSSNLFPRRSYPDLCRRKRLSLVARVFFGEGL